ncbi:MAG: methylmalonyl Co-A mutase-associated GTPase MeaB [Acidimicrobiales bacterium]
MADDPADLLERARDGDRAALARLLSLVERGGPAAREVGALTHPAGGHAYTVGITGAPGAGKSTLTSALVRTMRRQDVPVAVLAIDPSSPFSGGAILGDRVRMGDHSTDDGVFIRSMATRGHLGGLSLATLEAIRALDATGWPWVLVETVGVGQVEVEVAGAADTTVVVVNPGWGDAVQANKAGLLEIADLFVINKADRPGAEETRRDLERMLDLTGTGHEPGGWRPPVVATTASTGDGVDDLWEAIGAHRAHLERDGALEARRAARVSDELVHIVAALLHERSLASAGDQLAAAAADVARRHVDPWTWRRDDGVACSAMADTPLVLVERRGDGVAVLRLDHPKVNALSSELLRQLASAAEGLREDPPGAVVVTGGDRIFAAGAEISEFRSAEAPDEVITRAEAELIGQLFLRALNAVADIPRATIAAISGFALGGGCELALACDFRIASEKAKLGQPEILLGIIPGGGGTQRLARLVGPARAKDLIFSGRQVRADEALAMGLVDEVVPPEEVLDRALDKAAALASGAVAAQGLAKRAIDRGLDITLNGGLDLEQQLFADVFTTDDAKVGVQSFLEHGPGKATFTGR